MSYPLSLIIALLPSLIWLLFFLRRDVHPEPKKMVLKIFSWGALITLPAIFIERGVFELFEIFGLPRVLYIFFGIAGVEEILKYLIVKEKVLSDPEFDEPLDSFLYMVISALGFAALENILFFFSPEIFLLSFEEVLVLASFRFITATFLHALCSGLVGFFIALSCLDMRNQTRLVMSGLGIAIILHGLYDFSIMMTEGPAKFLIPVIIIISLAITISLGLRTLMKMKSICQPFLLTEKNSKIKVE
jgi:RsiW-degrading membrane proteinase PrsW (M82 family)